MFCQRVGGGGYSIHARGVFDRGFPLVGIVEDARHPPGHFPQGNKAAAASTGQVLAEQAGRIAMVDRRIAGDAPQVGVRRGEPQRVFAQPVAAIGVSVPGVGKSTFPTVLPTPLVSGLAS